MASVPDVAHGCAKILVPLLYFLRGGSYPRNPAADEAAVFLIVVLPMAYLAGVILAHFASVVLANLPATAPAPGAAAVVSFAGLWRFVVMVFTLVSAWLLVITVALAAFFFFLDAGTGGFVPGFSFNVLSQIQGQAP